MTNERQQLGHAVTAMRRKKAIYLGYRLHALKEKRYHCAARWQRIIDGHSALIFDLNNRISQAK